MDIASIAFLASIGGVIIGASVTAGVIVLAVRIADRRVRRARNRNQS